MPKLKDSERRLLLAFSGVIFLLGNFALLRWVMATVDQQKQFGEQLANEQLSADGWLAQRAMWEERANWLGGKQPVIGDEGQALSSLLSAIQQSASQAGVTLSGESFMDPERKPGLTVVGVKVEFTGPFEGVVTWLGKLQSPELFQEVAAFEVKSTEEPPKVIGSLVLSRHYAAPDAGTSEPPATASVAPQDPPSAATPEGTTEAVEVGKDSPDVVVQGSPGTAEALSP